MSQQERQVQRPWTVIVLSVWSALGFVWTLLFSDGWQISDLLSLAVSVLFIRAYWAGQRWAFHLTFAGALLCAIFLLGSVVLAPEQLDFADKVLSGAAVVGTIYLVRHPATKGFLRLDERPDSSLPPGPPDRGGRVAQALAISMFGILAIALPLLWTFGKADGMLLVVGLFVGIGSGIAVLVLGMPAEAPD